MYYQVGYYQKPFGTQFISVELSKVLNNIRGTNFKKMIDHARSLYMDNKFEEYTLFKNTLPAVTFSGLFSPTRSAANITEYSSLMVLDIDHIGPELLTIKKALSIDPYIVSAWLSPSGDGLKFLIMSSADASQHKEVYKQATQYYNELLNIEIDKSGSDVSRLCFISHDPDIFINPNFKIFDRYSPIVAKEVEKPIPVKRNPVVTSSSNTPKNYDEAAKNLCKKIYHYLNKRNLSITGTYSNWVRTGFAISNTFPPSYGISLFLDFCRLDGSNHDEAESERLISSCYQKGSSTSTFKTIIYLAQEQGYQVDFNNRNKKNK